MRFLLAGIAVLLAPLASGAAAQDEQRPTPADFAGDWMGTLDPCKRHFTTCHVHHTFGPFEGEGIIPAEIRMREIRCPVRRAGEWKRTAWEPY